MFMKGFVVSLFLTPSILTAVLWNIFLKKKSILYTCLRYLSITVEELYTVKFLNTTEVQIFTSWECVWKSTSGYAFIHYKTKHLQCPIKKKQ